MMRLETRRGLEEAGHDLKDVDRLEFRQEICWRSRLKFEPPCSCMSSEECKRVGKNPLSDFSSPHLSILNVLDTVELSANQVLALMKGDASVRFHGSFMRRRD